MFSSKFYVKPYLKTNMFFMLFLFLRTSTYGDSLIFLTNEFSKRKKIGLELPPIHFQYSLYLYISFSCFFFSLNIFLHWPFFPSNTPKSHLFKSHLKLDPCHSFQGILFWDRYTLLANSNHIWFKHFDLKHAVSFLSFFCANLQIVICNSLIDQSLETCSWRMVFKLSVCKKKLVITKRYFLKNLLRANHPRNVRDADVVSSGSDVQSSWQSVSRSLY